MGGCCTGGIVESSVGVEEGATKYQGRRTQGQTRSSSSDADGYIGVEIEVQDFRDSLQERPPRVYNESPKLHETTSVEQIELKELRRHKLEHCRKIEELEYYNGMLQREVTDLKTEIVKIKCQNDTLNQQIEHNDVLKYTSIKNDNSELALKNEHLNREVERLKRENDRLNFESLSEMKTRCEQLEKENARGVHHLKQVTTENDRLNQTIGSLRRNQETVEAELRACKEQLEDMTCRFSKTVSDNLRLGNPALEDLSTANRPLALADRFRVDLYGGVWCDALDELMDGGLDEQSALLRLYETVTDVDKFCLAHRQRLLAENFNNLFFAKPNRQDDVIIRSSITDNLAAKLDRMTEQTVMDLLRKTFSPQTVASLQQLYTVTSQKQPDPQKPTAEGGMMEPDPQKPSAQGEMMAMFTALSLELCWLFAIQDPPMVLYSELPEDKMVDLNLYQSYKKAGKRARCVIWPALLLYSDGHVLCKGKVLVDEEPS